ncbi:kinase-like protein [Trametes cingulata]|nr:kinase-like protein [Trametes cingulata]
MLRILRPRCTNAPRVNGMRQLAKKLSLFRHSSHTAASHSAPSVPDQPSAHTTPRWAEAEEDPGDYNPEARGYLPVNVGDLLGQRYSVLRKLGWGIYSTVWLVQDTQTVSQAYAAAKVMNRMGTEAHEEGLLHELEFLQRIGEDSLHPGRAHVVQLREYFHQGGTGGNHLCIIMEPLLQDLRTFSLRWRRRLCPPALVRLLARQIVLGIQYLHDECNIIHTDIKPGNIMIVPPEGDLSFLSEAFSGTPETTIAERPDGRPITRLRSCPIEYPIPEFDPQDLASFEPWRGFKVKIGDFGVAWRADKVSEHPTGIIQSVAMRAPEVALGAGWGKPADIWSLGCTLYELHMGQSLLPENIAGVSVASLHWMCFGDYPRELIQRGKYSHIFYKEDGTLRVYPPSQRPYHINIFRRNAPDAALFSDFLGLTFKLHPDERATCAELLAHPWLNP